MITLWQAVLIALVAVLTELDGNIFGENKMREPIVTGFLVGLILGDVTKGLMLGAQMQLMWMGATAIGPTAGLDIGTGGTVGAAVAIATGDIKTLSKIKGLGKKTAELIVLNLREQVAVDMSDATTEIGGSMDADLSDAIFALVSLGVSNTEAVKAVQTAAKTASGVENIIAAALKLIG